ncbi:MAG TPA: biopolymer transporter [Desulfobacteraceae bacterium]|nr:biopolymer transporter [Desulfobacteraceae bacterium]
MKRIAPIILALGLAVWMTPASLAAQDMRQIQIEARQAREALAQKAAAEKKAAEAAAAESRARILADRQRLENAVKKQKARMRRLEEAIAALSAEAGALERQEAELTEKLSETDAVVRELVGVVRINAKDIDALVSQNLQTAFLDEDTDFLQAIASQSRFPDMDALERMADLLETAIQTSGEVTVRRGAIIDRSGRPAEAEILAIGNFTAAYRLGEEIGYLSYAPAGRQLFALSHLPPGRIQRRIAAYLDGESDTVPMDISRGAALRQLTHALSLWQQIPKGGPIVWPILAVLALGGLIVVERVTHLLRHRTNADALMQRIEGLMRERRDIDRATVFQGLDGKPVARVLRAGLACCRKRREELENALQEAILKEIPPMERFLSTLGLLAAIAPLLGLLGTVTGMIDTFHVITLHGTGDPRMMSGGISEALVTTMLGLAVAIPLMLAHTLLSRTVENRISQMEEKAVALVNLVDRYGGGETSPLTLEENEIRGDSTHTVA